MVWPLWLEYLRRQGSPSPARWPEETRAFGSAAVTLTALPGWGPNEWHLQVKGSLEVSRLPSVIAYP